MGFSINEAILRAKAMHPDDQIIEVWRQSVGEKFRIASRLNMGGTRPIYNFLTKQDIMASDWTFAEYNV